MAWRRAEPHHVGLALLLGSIVVLELYYELVGLQVNGVPHGKAQPMDRSTVMENLRREWSVPGNRQPLLSKYLVAGLGLPHVNTSSLILHGSLTPAKAGALELAATEVEELNQILPEEDFTHKYSSCAIVGNSASLLQYQFGNEIDGHDVVLRFNDAPTKGLEEHVGRRCTFRAVTYDHARHLMGVSEKQGHKFKDLKPGARTLILMPGIPARFYVDMRHKFQENVIMLMDPAARVGDAATDLYDTIVGRLADLGEREASQADRHSTGTSAAVFLMRACKKLSLYGFQPVAPPPGSAMPSSLYYSKTMTDSDVTATAISFLFWRVLNTENIVRLRC